MAGIDRKGRGRGKGKGLCRWFKPKRTCLEGSFSARELSVGDYEDDVKDDVFRRLSSGLLRMDPDVSQNELRIFVGTWNVAGRSPAGSLTVELDEWLNLKDAADLYVLGFQEIVPLKTKNVIGGEDLTEASNWNMLIGKALNERYKCPWSRPVVHPISDESCPRGDSSNDQWQKGGTSHIISETEDNSESSMMPEGLHRYKFVVSKKMVGVFITVWVRRELLLKYHISNVNACAVPCGIMNCFGNKGSVSVSMAIEGTSFCFITVHLASGEKKGDEGRRNRQVSEIFRRTTFPRSRRDIDESRPLTILGHDQIFWFGDLNYRLYGEKHMARQLIKGEDWRALQEFDQLRREREDGVFQGWEEGDIQFAPTYKYSSSNSNRYSGGLPRRPGEKPRIPAWCDRIMWHGKGVRLLSYLRSEIKFSDHRPVSAMFTSQIGAAKPDSRVVPLPTIIPAETPASALQENGLPNKEHKTTLPSTILRDMRSSKPIEVRRLEEEQVLLEGDDRRSHTEVISHEG